MKNPLLQVIICSTRPRRVGPAIARWFFEIARTRDSIDVELIDLLDVALPLFNEPNQPVTGQYQFEHTKRWSEIVTRADAFVLVTPEYNHSYNAATKNALDYLYAEWHYKPVGLVCYGGAAKGTRAAQHLKPVFNALKLVHGGDVSVSLAATPVTNEIFVGDDSLERSASALLDELAQLTSGLHSLRYRSTE